MSKLTALALIAGSLLGATDIDFESGRRGHVAGADQAVTVAL